MFTLRVAKAGVGASLAIVIVLCTTVIGFSYRRRGWDRLIASSSVEQTGVAVD